MLSAHDRPKRMSRGVAIALGCIILVGGYGAYIAWAIHTVPSDDVALRLSLAEINKQELTTAVTLHPDYCSIDGGPGRGWNVECLGVPLHHYIDASICQVGTPKICAPMPTSWTDCRSFYWNIDMWRRPSNPMIPKGKYASIEDPCREKASYAADREEMKRRGLALAKHEF